MLILFSLLWGFCLGLVVDEPVLFFDAAIVHSATGVFPQNHRPTQKNASIVAQYPWESYPIFAYNQVLDLGEEKRLYYDCGAEISGAMQRFVCFANSSDGIVWHKPMLHIATFENSTENNILWPPSDKFSRVSFGSVLREGGQFFMVVHYEPMNGEYGSYVLRSEDGLVFEQMFAGPSLQGSDTQNVLLAHNGSWVGYMRIDDTSPDEHGGQTCSGGGLSRDERRIGRCVFGNLSSFGCSNTNASMVFSFDAKDPVCLDIYTNAATPYPSADNAAVILFFPAVYSHIEFPNHDGNAGLVETRFAFALNHSQNISYLNDDRSAWYPLGIKRCPLRVPSVSPEEYVWCDDSAEINVDDVNSATVYGSPGYVDAGCELYFYAGAALYTHGQESHHWSNQASAVLRYSLRKDGFVSLSGDYNFQALPTVTLGPFQIPDASACTPPASGMYLSANIHTSVAGFAKFGLLDEDLLPIPSFSLNESTPIKGNWIDAHVSWRSGNTSLASLHNKIVYIQAQLPDTDLYSLRFSCSNTPYATGCAFESPQKTCNAPFIPLPCTSVPSCADLTCGGVPATCNQNNICEVQSGPEHGNLCGAF